MNTLNWTAAKIREQWLNDQDADRAIQRAEFQLRKMDEGSRMTAHFPDPSILYTGHAVLVTPQKLSESIQGEQKERAALLSLIQELQEYQAMTPSADRSKRISEQLGRMVWKGAKADLGRIYGGLPSRLLDCSAAEWERHFVGPNGEDMTGAVENAQRLKNSTSRSAEIVALESMIGKMKAEEPKK